MLVGVAPPPSLIPASCNIGILLHKQATLRKHFPTRVQKETLKCSEIFHLKSASWSYSGGRGGKNHLKSSYIIYGCSPSKKWHIIFGKKLEIPEMVVYMRLVSQLRYGHGNFTGEICTQIEETSRFGSILRNMYEYKTLTKLTLLSRHFI